MPMSDCVTSPQQSAANQHRAPNTTNSSPVSVGTKRALDQSSEQSSKRARVAALSGSAGVNMLPNNTTGRVNGVCAVRGQSNTPQKNTVVKKLTIKNLKVRPKLPDDYYAKSWAQLKEAVTAVHECRAVDTSLEQLYQAVENVSEEPSTAAQLYDSLRELCQQHVSAVLPRLAECSHDRSAWLQALDQAWRAHCQHMILIRSIFLYLDRTYVLQACNLLSVWDMGMDLWRSVVVCEQTVSDLAVDGLLQLITNERMGEQVDRALCNSLLKMLCSVQMYQSLFEKRFLSDSAVLYELEGKQLVQELPCALYLEHVQRRLFEEQDRLNYYLDYSTRKPLIHCLELHLIQTHITTLLDKGLSTMLAEDKREQLRLMYSLLLRVEDGIAQLKLHFAQYIKNTGKQLVLNVERDKTLVQDLMEFKDTMDSLVTECFQQNERFSQAEKDAFDNFINLRSNKPAELIAKFMDNKLRSGNKEASEDELGRLMDKLIILFRFIQGKDVFEAFYKKDLAKRLLLGRSASVDAEKAMLSKLKAECGAGFTSKLEGMFKDMDLSKELGLAFKEMTEYQELFKGFYLSKHSGRKLQWQPSLGQTVLRAQFQPNVVKELQVSLLQTLVLLLFNDEREEWALEDIRANTNIELGELKRTLQSLACGKFRPIQKTPRGKDINDTDLFSFNSACNDRLFRIRISQVQMRETEEEQQATTEQVFQDRQYSIDAAVVRIMKARKSLTHNQLIAELFAQLRFPTKAGDLKKRIESLIDRDYLCRDKEDNNSYNYVA